VKGNNSITPIKPDILIWARNRLNLELADVSHKIGQKEAVISEWEEGKKLPSLSQLEKLAYDIYKVPLATFFLPEVPNEPKVNQQFRTIPETDINMLPPKFMQRVKEAQYFQEVLKELYNGVNPAKTPLLKKIQVNDSFNIEGAANFIRSTLNISTEKQESFKNSNEAFKYYRTQLESDGIFIFQQTLKDICRGYSLFDSEFPIIVINSSEISDTGKNFTLFHELSHLIHQTGGISNEFSYSSKNSIEIICNKLASLILIDIDDLINKLETYKISPEQINDLQLNGIASQFKVSKEVILRKLLDMDLTSKQYYELKRKEWLSNLPQRKKSKGGHHFNIKMSQLSHSYSSSIFTKMYAGAITKYQAAEFLNTKINHLQKIEKLVFK
jgi:Zn-dependent peptidase ImmA (M78 family)/transcriptional regulator with XRE-family HTH domain